MNSKKFNRYVARLLKGMSSEEIAILDSFEDSVDRSLGTLFKEEPGYEVDIENGEITLLIDPELHIPVEKRHINKLTQLLDRQGYELIESTLGDPVVILFQQKGGTAKKAVEESSREFLQKDVPEYLTSLRDLETKIESSIDSAPGPDAEKVLQEILDLILETQSKIESVYQDKIK